MTAEYHLGCPVWACPDWVGSLFSTRDRTKWLEQYSKVFSTVEGNSTFYGLPSRETVERWARTTAKGFQFCLKFPRSISHGRRLIDAESETGLFLDILSVLTESGRSGPSFLQLPPTFSFAEFDRLQTYLEGLPAEFSYAVEVRHPDFFDEGTAETTLNEALRALKIDRVLFDSRPLFSRPPADSSEEVAQSRKPRSPLRRTVTGTRPMLRLVGRNSVHDTRPWIEEWAETVADWIRAGLEPYVFTHSPNDAFAPELASTFHSTLQTHLPSLAELPAWPGRKDDTGPRQLHLFR